MRPQSAARAAALVSGLGVPKTLNVDDPASIRHVASTVAYGLMSWYSGNVTNTPDTIGIFPKPHYWWEAGAAWGAMLDYYHYTGDATYNDVVTRAVLSQVSPTYDFMMPSHFGDLGNDDQAFWSFVALDAAERNFPQPDPAIPPWLDIARNVFDSMASRWNTSACGGGLAWQIFSGNPNGMTYFNSVANGGFMQLAARLARATGNQTYATWADRVWDWSWRVGFIDADSYYIYDGADSKDDCRTVNKLQFTYTQGIYLYGAAVMQNYTGGSDSRWADRTAGLLRAAEIFFSPPGGVPGDNIMYEAACEPNGKCNTDMKSFKGYLARFMWATARVVPSALPQVQRLLRPSAVAAGKACSGGDNGTVCGQKWYGINGGYDGVPGMGQQMSALEVIQGLLAERAAPPLPAGEIRHVGSGGGTSPYSIFDNTGSNKLDAEASSSAASSSSLGVPAGSSSSFSHAPNSSAPSSLSHIASETPEATAATAPLKTTAYAAAPTAAVDWAPSSPAPASAPAATTSTAATADAGALQVRLTRVVAATGLLGLIMCW